MSRDTKAPVDPEEFEDEGLLESEKIAQEQSKMSTQDQVNDRLARAIEMLAEKQDAGPVKQIPLPKAKIRTPWNPTGKKARDRAKFERQSYMNGHRLREGMHHEREIELFNQIRHGRYLNGKVTVLEISGGAEGSDRVDLYVKNKTIQDRLEMASFAPSLEILLTNILAEQSAA